MPSARRLATDRRNAGAGALACLVALAGCAAQQVCVPPARGALQAELLFGLSLPDGGVVTQAQFDAFVAAQLTPRFPDGLTVLPGRGQWREAGPGHAIVAEGARLVMVAAPDDAATRTKLQQVRQAYRSAFKQESVGLITIQSCTSMQ